MCDQRRAASGKMRRQRASFFISEATLRTGWLADRLPVGPSQTGAATRDVVSMQRCVRHRPGCGRVWETLKDSVGRFSPATWSALRAGSRGVAFARRGADSYGTTWTSRVPRRLQSCDATWSAVFARHHRADPIVRALASYRARLETRRLHVDRRE